MLFRSQYIYAKNVLTPRIKMREQAINTQLLPLFGDGLIWRYNPVIPYDKDFDKTKALEAYNAGIITRNEARRLIDLPDIKDGDVFKVSVNDLFLKETDNPAEVSQLLLQKDTTKFPEENYEEKSKQIDASDMFEKESKAIQENTLLFELAAEKYFVNQQITIEKALGLTEKAKQSSVFSSLSKYLLPDGTFNQELWTTLSETEQQHLAEGIASGLLDWDKEVEKLIELLYPLWEKTYDDGAAINKESYKLFDIERPEFVSAAKINGGKRIVGIQQTTKNKIAEIIVRGVSGGISQVTLKKMIQKEMQNSSKSRVKLIARQETMTALATGQFDMMKSAGAKTKTWHHRPQKNPRDGSHGPNHIALEGETVDIDAKFSNGLRFPKDPHDARPEEVINCRCYLTYDGF